MSRGHDRSFPRFMRIRQHHGAIEDGEADKQECDEKPAVTSIVRMNGGAQSFWALSGYV